MTEIERQAIQPIIDAWNGGVSRLLVAQFVALTDEQRMLLMDIACRHCGSLEPNCQCWNDE